MVEWFFVKNILNLGYQNPFLLNRFVMKTWVINHFSNNVNFNKGLLQNNNILKLNALSFQWQCTFSWIFDYTKRHINFSIKHV